MVVNAYLDGIQHKKKDCISGGNHTVHYKKRFAVFPSPDGMIFQTPTSRKKFTYSFFVTKNLAFSTLKNIRLNETKLFVM